MSKKDKGEEGQNHVARKVFAGPHMGPPNFTTTTAAATSASSISNTTACTPDCYYFPSTSPPDSNTQPPRYLPPICTSSRATSTPCTSSRTPSTPCTSFHTKLSDGALPSRFVSVSAGRWGHRQDLSTWQASLTK